MPDQNAGPILLVNMFSGSFLEENIAHEIINLFQSDNGETFFYMPANGNMSNKIVGKAIRDNKSIKIIMVHRVDVGKYEVLGRAEVDNEAFRDEKGQLNVSPFYKSEKQKEILNSTKYNGESLMDIMEAVNQRLDGIHEKVTFRVKHCYRPASRITINLTRDLARMKKRINENASVVCDEDTGFPSEVFISMLSSDSRDSRNLFRTQREYILPEGYFENDNEAHIQPYAYDQLNKIFDIDAHGDFWIPMETVRASKTFFPDNASQDGLFLSLIGKEDSELAYSNMLAHYLNENDDLNRSFIKLLLKKAKPGDSPMSVDLIPLDIAREKKHIDILINTVNTTFILENKVNAKLDEASNDLEWDDELGRVKYADGQLQRYVYDVNKLLENNVAEKDGDADNDAGKNASCNASKEIVVFIICPTRNRLYQDYKDSVKTHGKEGILRYIYRDEGRKKKLYVHVISYKEILDVLHGFSEVNGGTKENEYFNDFKSLLEWQEEGYLQSQSRRLFDLSYKRFLRAIDIAKLKPEK